jgi:hypothetical protein
LSHAKTQRNLTQRRKGAKFGSEVVKDSVDAVLESGFTEQ